MENKVILLLLLAVLSLGACRLSNDGPPTSSAPEPAPLNGVYVGPAGSMMFNGDGRSVSVHFTDSDLVTLSADSMKYVFTYGVTGGEVRYDLADRFLIWETEDTVYSFHSFQCSPDSLDLTYFLGDKMIDIKLLRKDSADLK